MRGVIMHWRLQGMCSLGALALLCCLAGLPAFAGDTFPAPDPAAAAPESGASPAEGAKGFTAMPPGQGGPLTGVKPGSPRAERDGEEQLSSETNAVPPEAGGEAAGLPGANFPAETAAAQSAPPADGTEAAAPQNARPAVDSALKAALEARSGHSDPLGLLRHRERESVAAFYAARDFAPLWWNGITPSVEAGPVFERLRHAADDGLDLKGFRLAFSPATDEEIAAADIALTDAVVAYGRQASGSRVDPQMISRLIGSAPEAADPAVILALVSSAGEGAGEELRRFNPPQKGYQALREKLLQLRRGHGLAGRDPALPAGPVLHRGMRDPRVPLIRARLSHDGQIEASQDPGDTEELLYDSNVAAAVADFQKANGLPASGKLTARTAAALSGGHTSHLEAEILANMERWRWMPRDMGERRIEVNIPDYEAAIIEGGEVVERTRVIVGKEKTPTPVFSETMRFLIVNPYWNVPPSIIRNEMLPRLGSLHRLGYEVFSRGGRLVVRQPPGERNALGRIKFMFPNDFSVYMHDTPTRHLFASQKRAFSHGCVRVDAPFRFAETVLGRSNGWSEQRVRKLIGGRERYVYLPKPLPVHIEYFT
ncbi:MAG: L,D-transpeptidase family protein, partial [Beijerinckiaceae bacterium]|nr:L,D-transpeptidase family protein [Beijerinckiaceae bacterium]